MFSQPQYLFALAGLSIPVVIHFLSRKEGKVIKLGSVRHVIETSTQQFKGIKLNEIILLMLRCSMIIIFTLLLSGLQCSNPGNEKWAIVEKGLERSSNLNSILDSLEKDNYSFHLLAKGFPDLKDSSSSNAEINYWQLVEELKQKNLSEAIVFSKNNAENFKGMRQVIPANIRWISQPLPAFDFPLQAVRLDSDSVSLRVGHTSADKTFFTSEKVSTNASPIAITLQDTIKIALVSDPEFNYDRKIIKAALLAIEKSFPVKMVLMEASPSQTFSNSTKWCIWLSSKKLERINAKKIVRADLRAGNELISQTETNEWIITKRLNEEVTLRNNLTTQLATLILQEKNLDEKVRGNDRRMVSDSLVWNRADGGKEIQASIQQESADKYLIILLLALLFIERILAYRRNQ